MKIEPMQPIDGVVWDQVEFVRVTLEQPTRRGGGLRFRCGTRAAIKNANFNPRDPRNNRTHIPGAPIMYPPDAPAVVGTESASFIMPASSSRMMYVRDSEGHPAAMLDPEAQAAWIAFGYFAAPLQEGTVSAFTLSSERERVAMFWGDFKYPQPASGAKFPPTTRVAPPDVPAVALTLLDGSMRPILVDGAEVVIRPREFWDFDNMTMYDTSQEAAPEMSAIGHRPAPRAESAEVVDLRAQVAELRALIEGKNRGKAATG